MNFDSIDDQKLEILYNLILEEKKKRQNTSLNSIFQLHEKYPNLKVLENVLVTYIEYVLICFLEELFSNYDDQDYSLDDWEIPSFNNDIKITNTYSNLDFKDGQYPKIVVKSEAAQLNRMFLNNDAPHNTKKMIGITKTDEKSLYLTVPATINILAQNYNETNIIGSLVQVTLAQNLDILRNIFNFYDITEPQLNAARKVKEPDDLFIVTINISFSKYIEWLNLLKEKAFKNMIIRLIAKIKNDTEKDQDDFIHFFGTNNDFNINQNIFFYLMKKNGNIKEGE